MIKIYCREVDRCLDELMLLKHEKLEIEKRLRRLKFEKSNSSNSNNVKKLGTLIREKELNSSDNESPDENDRGGMLLCPFLFFSNIKFLESMKGIIDETTIIDDPAAATANDQDIETIDETKIDDLDKRLTLVTRKYILIKRRVIEKHCRIRALHLGLDRYRRHYWYFSYLPGIYVEGLRSGDMSPNDIKETVQNAMKQKLDKRVEINSLSRSAQRKKQQTKITNITPVSVNSMEQSISIELNQIKHEHSGVEEEQQQNDPSMNVVDDLAAMDLSAFCMAANKDNNREQSTIIESEPSDKLNNNKRDYNEINDDNLPLDLSCSKSKRSCEQDYWMSKHKQAENPLQTSLNKNEPFQKLTDFVSAAALLNHIKRETVISKDLSDLRSTDQMKSASAKQEPQINTYKQIEQTIKDKFQYRQPLPIPDGKIFSKLK